MTKYPSPSPEQIRALLAERGWTQAQLAHELRVPKRQVERWLEPRSDMWPTAWRLARLLAGRDDDHA